MNRHQRLLTTTSSTLLAALGMLAFAGATRAATTVQIGNSGKTFASTAVQCTADPSSGLFKPSVEAGLFNPKRTTTASVSVNGSLVKNVSADDPVATVWLADGSNSVSVALSKRTVDRYAFTVTAGQCNLPDTSRNTFSADGTVEYAASGKSYATVTPGCALNPATAQPQPYVTLFDNGGFLLNVSVNDVPLTQLSATRPRTPVFLRAGFNVISAANGTVTTDYFLRDGGTGTCVLAP